MAIPVEHENIGYDSNNKSTFNGNIDSAVSNLKKAEKETKSLQGLKQPHRTIIGRRFNKESIIEQCKSSIGTCYDSLSSVQSSVQEKVSNHILADKMVSNALKKTSFALTLSSQIGLNSGKYGSKSVIGERGKLLPNLDTPVLEKGEPSPEPRYLSSEPLPGFTPDPFTKKGIYYIMGLAKRGENLMDGCLTYVGPVVSSGAGVIFGQEASNKVGATFANFIKTDFAGDHLLDLEKKYNMTRTSSDMTAYRLGEDTFDIAVSATLSGFGAGPAGGYIYSLLSGSGTMSEKIYNSPNINTNSLEDRMKTSLGAAAFGGANVFFDYTSEKLDSGWRAIDNSTGTVLGGIGALSAGGMKSLSSEIIYDIATGEEFRTEEENEEDIKYYAKNQGINYLYRIVKQADKKKNVNKFITSVMELK